MNEELQLLTTHEIIKRFNIFIDCYELFLEDHDVELLKESSKRLEIYYSQFMEIL